MGRFLFRASFGIVTSINTLLKYSFLSSDYVCGFDPRTTAGKQEDAGQINQRNRKGEARSSGAREETNS